MTTPLIAIGRNVTVKDEGRLPTGSFKARGLALAVAMAKELGLAHLAMPSNGNAGAALAAYAARAGLKATVFCPEDTPEVNLSEIAVQGGRVYRVNGLIDDCGKLVAAGKAAQGWFDVSTLKEPYRLEGKKTMGLELAEQLGWRLPQVIFYPTGGGTGLIGMWKVFHELKAMGWLDGPLPRMVAVQATGCAPMVRAWEQGRGARAALGERRDGRRRHPRAGRGRRLPDPARGARERRLRARGRRRRDPGSARSSGAHDRVAAVARRVPRRWPPTSRRWPRARSPPRTRSSCSTAPAASSTRCRR